MFVPRESSDLKDVDLRLSRLMFRTMHTGFSGTYWYRLRKWTSLIPAVKFIQIRFVADVAWTSSV